MEVRWEWNRMECTLSRKSWSGARKWKPGERGDRVSGSQVRMHAIAVGKHGFWDSVSGSWKNWTGEYCTRVESTVLEIAWVAHGKIERASTALGWKARFLRYREWLMEKPNGRLPHSGGKIRCPLSYSKYTRPEITTNCPPLLLPYREQTQPWWFQPTPQHYGSYVGFNADPTQQPYLNHF